MKKWIGALCSGLAGVLSLVFLAMPAFTMKAFGAKESFSGWDILTKKEWAELDLTAVTWYRIFAWIMVVLAIVLIVVAILQVLANLGVIKMPAIVSTVAKYALIAIAVAAVLTLVANFGIRAEYIKEIVGGKKVLEAAKGSISVGIALWFAAIVNVAAAVCGKLFAKNED